VKPKEIRELSVEELCQKEKDLKGEFFNLKIQLATNQLANTMHVKQVGKDIARVKTILKEKEIQV
jgi:large subunit ribosomal protein L29